MSPRIYIVTKCNVMHESSPPPVWIICATTSLGEATRKMMRYIEVCENLGEKYVRKGSQYEYTTDNREWYIVKIERY